jgi:isoleucyl-tRNA synthetase
MTHDELVKVFERRLRLNDDASLAHAQQTARIKMQTELVNLTMQEVVRASGTVMMMLLSEIYAKCTRCGGNHSLSQCTWPAVEKE